MTRITLWGLLMLALILPNYAVAVDIDLRQSNNTKTALGGVADAAKVTIVGSSGSAASGCTPTAAAPAYVEGVDNALSCDLAGNARVTQGTLEACEDQTNGLCRTSGGAVRQTVWATISTNATSATGTMPTGTKTVKGTLVCNAGGSTNCGITFALYGNELNSTTGGELLCTTVIPTGAATTPGTCPAITAAFSYYYLITTGVAGTSPVLTVTGMY